MEFRSKSWQKYTLYASLCVLVTYYVIISTIANLKKCLFKICSMKLQWIFNFSIWDRLSELKRGVSEDEIRGQITL